MKKKWISGWMALCLLLSLAGCYMPGTVVNDSPNLDGTVAAEVAIAHAAQTMVAQTLAAEGGGVDASTRTFTPEVNQQQDTPTPSLTPTFTETPTITQTSTPEGVKLVVSSDTNCRDGGPYKSFPIVVTVKAGQLVEVIARNPEFDSYYVKNPYANGYCWMYGQYATLMGDTSTLAVATSHPTPTPTFTPTPSMNFTVSYVGLETCGVEYAFKLFIKNTGGVTWQSIQITGSDTVTGFVINHTSNTFKEFAGCAIALTQSDLTQGEESYVLNVAPGQFAYDPTGNNIVITVSLCSLDNGAGSCLSKNLSFTP